MAVAWAVAWEQVGVESALGVVWKRVAYATRYGHCGLGEALRMPQEQLQHYLDALSEIVQEENEANKPSR
jgi:hypothetical protein